MLDNGTKKRIDDCRNILVGKLPDPKSQIEQITIALIYKFMDDMDKEAINLGGAAKFFSGEYAKYSWNALFDSRVTSVEMLKLYSEAIESMEKNPNIPQLFRDIFKNAYLPYRDPETLRLFLKTIGEFEYTHSEKLGDAFEYLLSVMGSQGDAGQFRTPRHIIDFIVEAVEPGKNDTVLDPACGTAGFLISAFKHIREKGGKQLTPDEHKRIIRNLVGYDISPDMVRLSLVNLYLHGFTDPHISEYDTLTSEERWNETFDVILANPPFMSPKGGIRPHKKFTVSSNRSEVLFVDYIAEHLNPGGKAGVIVPEGIIFQSGKAYKELRKMLVDQCLWAVVSLPAGVFNPYSGVKTSILLLDKEVAKKTDNLLFVKIDNDGYNLGAQRIPVKGAQLGEAIQIINLFKDDNFSDSPIAHVVQKSVISSNAEYNLSGERYKINEIINTDFPLKKISDVCVVNPLKSELKEILKDTKVSFVPMAVLNENNINFNAIETKKLGDVYNGYTYFKDNDILIAKVTPCFENGKAGIAKSLKNGIGFGSSEFYVLRNNEKSIPEYIYWILKSPIFKDNAISKMTGTGGLRRVPKSVISDFKIPLPPLSVQEEIVAEIEGYQKIIDGARMVVENYKPHIKIDPKWEMVELGNVCTKITDGSHFSPETTDEGYPYITVRDLNDGIIDFEGCKKIEEKKYLELVKSGCKPAINDVLFSKDGTVGKTAIVDFEKEFVVLSSLAIISPDKQKILAQYLFQMLSTDYFINKAIENKTGVAIRRIVLKTLKTIHIPLPPLDVQYRIVAQIQKEKGMIEASKNLIELYEQKIKDRINEVWGAGS